MTLGELLRLKVKDLYSTIEEVEWRASDSGFSQAVVDGCQDDQCFRTGGDYMRVRHVTTEIYLTGDRALNGHIGVAVPADEGDPVFKIVHGDRTATRPLKDIADLDELVRWCRMTYAMMES